MSTLPRPAWVALAAAIVAGATALAVVATSSGSSTFAVHGLVADTGRLAQAHDPSLVNAWGLAASSTGPWWTANEARDTSTLYAANGRKQALTVTVEGGPTGVVFSGGHGFPIRAAGRSAPARFVYASEDGMIRAWAPSVPSGWSTRAEVVVDRAGEAAVFRGLTIATLPGGAERLFATDFHNGRVDVFDSRWRPVVRPRAFVDPAIPEWYAPFGIQAVGDRVFVTFAWHAPVNGNDAPTGGYVDEFDLRGRLVSRVAAMGPLNEPWGLAVAPRGFGRLAGSLLVGNFGSGRIDVFTRRSRGWAFRGQLRRRDGRPIAISGLWALQFGNGGMAGPRDTLFFTAGPHRWFGSSELAVHGLLGAITPSRG